MKDFRNWLNTTSSPYYDRAIKQTDLLKDQFGVSHFWYYKITDEGKYSHFGSNRGWNEYCIDHDLIKPCLNLRHPSSQPLGINFIGAGATSTGLSILDIAWEKFRINFNLNITSKVKGGVESFGFATRFNDPWVNQRLLNELPLLRHFTKVFRERNEKFFQMIDDHAIDLASKFGAEFYNCPKMPTLSCDRKEFIRKLGFEEILSLSAREIELLKFLLNGFPAAYIASELHLSPKTVENYLATIKIKLSCDTKVELIQKAKEIAATGYFEQ